MQTKIMQNVFIGLALLAVILFFACDENATEPNNDPKHPKEVVGTWNSTSMTANLCIITNSDQQAVDIYSEGNGAIVLSGAQQAELKLMYAITENNITEVYVSNHMDFEEYPCYTLELVSRDEPEARLIASLNENESEFYSGKQTNFKYDKIKHSLTATNAKLFTYDSSASVTVNGTLINYTKNVPANTITIVSSYQPPEAEQTQTKMTFTEEGNFFRTSVEDSAKGTWEVTAANKMTVIETYIEDGETMTDTLYLTYSVGSGKLTFELDEDICFDAEEPAEEKDCFYYYESFLGLDSGSLENVFMRMVIRMAKSQNKPTVNSSGFNMWSHRELIRNKLSKSIKYRIEQIKNIESK